MRIEIFTCVTVYRFSQATELINNELPGDVSYEIVTVVVQDVDDERPEFNGKEFTTSVSEDISEIIIIYISFYHKYKFVFDLSFLVNIHHKKTYF